MNKKIFGFIAFFAFAAVPIWMVVADDETEEIEEYEEEEYFEEEESEQRVVARMTCDDIKVKISELQSIVEPTDEETSELDSLLKKQRSQCAAQGRSRPVRNYANRGPQLEAVEEVVVEEVLTEKPKKETKKKVESKSENVVEEPVKTQQEIDAERATNLANGLCADGAKPNKFGCCDGEKFKDLGNLKFACCPKEGDGECHAPIQK